MQHYVGLDVSVKETSVCIAQMMRVGLYRPVHVKTLVSQKRSMLLTSRQLLQAKALDIENDLRGTLPRSKVSMMIMRPPQCGQGCGSLSSVAWAGSAWRFGTASSSRARVMLSAQTALANRP